MKILKKFDQYIKEDIQNVADIRNNPDFKYILSVVTKVKSDVSSSFYLKEPIVVGTCTHGDVFCNSIDAYTLGGSECSINMLFNKKPDRLTGCVWKFGSIYLEEDDNTWKYTRGLQHKNVDLNPDFLSIIANEIKSYSDLNDWINELNEMFKKKSKYRYMINFDKKMTWDEQIDWIKTNIKSDKLLNRHDKPFDEDRLKEMLELGEEEYTKVEKERNDRAIKMLNDMRDIEE